MSSLALIIKHIILNMVCMFCPANLSQGFLCHDYHTQATQPSSDPSFPSLKGFAPATCISQDSPENQNQQGTYMDVCVCIYVCENI